MNISTKGPSISFEYHLFISLKNRKDIEENIKDLLIRIKKIYKIKLSGYYKIKIYKNDLNGLIFEYIILLLKRQHRTSL